MKKFVLTLIACCSLNCFAMDEQHPQKTLSGFVGTSSKPKESFLLIREKFSDSIDIKYDGLEDHIHYQFKDKGLLRDALYPMIPKRLGADKLKFEHLEFLGDSVLGLIIRERLVILFPKENRGTLAELYSLLTKNQTLADVYFRNLELERYIPVPENPSCKICNLVESLIGGIYLDDLTKGYINSKKFVMHILNDHVLEEKIREISLIKGIELASASFPALEETIRRVCTPERLESDSPKTLLNEVLLGLWTDRPTYEISIRKEGLKGLPAFSALVSGAQIGNVLRGEGYTRQEAEEDAARNALNYLAKRELLRKKDNERANRSFSIRLQECLDILGYKWKFKDVTPQNFFKVQIRFQNQVVGEGVDAFQEEAKKIAVHQACQLLRTTTIFEEDKRHGSKNYRSLLKEFFDLSGSNNYKLGEPIFSQDVYKCQIEIGGDPIANGTGPSKAEAKEDAAKKAFIFLGKEKTGNYSPLLQLFLMLEGLDRCEFNNITPGRTFTYQVLDADSILGEGAGLTETEAKENAAHKAYFHLIQMETKKTKYREKLKCGERPKPLTPRTTIPKEQKNRESSLFPILVPKQSFSKQVIKSTTHEKPIKHPRKADQPQEQPKPNKHRAKSPAPKQPVVKSPSQGLSKPPHKSSTSNQTSAKQVKEDASSKKTVMKQPRDILNSEEPFPDNAYIGQ